MSGVTRHAAPRALLALLSAVVVALAGCFPSRQSIYTDVGGSRRESYARWRAGKATRALRPKTGARKPAKSKKGTGGRKTG